MKKKRFSFAIIIALVMILSVSLTACDDGGGSIQITEIKAADVNNLIVGDIRKLSVEVYPYNADDKSYTFEIIEGNDVISISEDGTIKALKEGLAEIKIKAKNGVEKIVNVSVIADAETLDYSITETKTIKKATDYNDGYYVVAKTSNNASDVKTVNIITTITPQKAEAFADIKFTSSDESVATVDNKGVVSFKPLPLGSTNVKKVFITITVDNKRVDDITKEILFQLCPYDVAQLTIDNQEVRVGSGETLQHIVNGKLNVGYDNFIMKTAKPTKATYPNINSSDTSTYAMYENFRYEPTAEDLNVVVEYKKGDNAYYLERLNLIQLSPLKFGINLSKKTESGEQILKRGEQTDATITITDKATGQFTKTTITIIYG